MKSLKIQLLNPHALTPDYHIKGDAGLDLYTADSVTISPDERVQIKTGLAMEIPKGYVGLVWDKSGNSYKRGAKVLGGVVDSGYRGEIMVGLINLSKETIQYEPHTPIAQMLIQKVERVKITTVKKLGATERGSKAFGSGDTRHKKI